MGGGLGPPAMNPPSRSPTEKVRRNLPPCSCEVADVEIWSVPNRQMTWVLLTGDSKKNDVEMMRAFFFGNKNQGVKGISEMAHFEMFCVGHV